WISSGGAVSAAGAGHSPMRTATPWGVARWWQRPAAVPTSTCGSPRVSRVPSTPARRQGSAWPKSADTVITWWHPAPRPPAACPPSGQSSRRVRPGWLDGGPFEATPVCAFNHLTLLMATELNEYRKPKAREVVGDRPTAAGDRPGDHFNARIAWGDILGPHGW